MSQKKILVTGAAGFVGKHMIEYLLKQGIAVRAMVRQNTDTALLQKLNVEIVYAGMSDKLSLVKAVEGVDGVIHLASTMKGPWEEYEESTIKGTRKLLEAVQEKGVRRFIYISTIAVYNLDKYQGQIINEDFDISTTNLSFYEKSKIHAEGVVREFVQRGVEAVIIRPGVIYGEGGQVYPSRLGFSLGSNKLLVIGNGDNKLPFVYVGNLVDAIYKAYQCQVKNAEVFQIIDDQTMSQNDYIGALRNIGLVPLKTIKLSLGAVRSLNGILSGLLGILKKSSPLRDIYLYCCATQINYSNEKAKKTLNWSSPIGPKDALRLTMEHIKNKRQAGRALHPKNHSGAVALNKPQNVALIGCGVIARTHLDILRKISGVKVVGLFDTNIEAAKILSKDYGNINVYNDLQALLKKEKVDSVHVLTPPQGRLDIVKQAAKQKCNIFLEKPMALNGEEAKLILEETVKNGVQVCLGHNHLFDPPMLEARQLVQSGALGKIMYAESWYGFNLGANLESRYMTAKASDHWSMKLPGQLYQNLISHPLSVLTDVMGCPQKLHVRATSANLVKAMTTDELRVIFENKETTGLLTVSLSVNPRYQFLNIYGTEMSIFVDFLNKTITKHASPKGIPKAISRALMTITAGWILICSTFRNMFKVALKRFTYFDGTETLIKEYYLRLTEGGPMPVSGKEGVESMEIMDEIWRQMRGLKG